MGFRLIPVTYYYSYNLIKLLGIPEVTLGFPLHKVSFRNPENLLFFWRARTKAVTLEFALAHRSNCDKIFISIGGVVSHVSALLYYSEHIVSASVLVLSSQGSFTINLLSLFRETNIDISVGEQNWHVSGDTKWLLPEDTDDSPVAFLVCTDETEAAEVHFFGNKLPSSWVLDGIMQPLVRWRPLGEGAGVLPHVLVVLDTLLDTGGVVVVSRGEGVARFGLIQEGDRLVGLPQVFWWHDNNSWIHVIKGRLHAVGQLLAQLGVLDER